MADAPDDSGSNDDAESHPDWPVTLTGVTETVVTTLGPNDRWNAAALGIRAPDEAAAGTPDDDRSGAVTATTWGNTRTRRNFRREGGGYVQFTRDPVTFVDAALSIVEVDDPVLDAADAWVRVDATQVDAGSEDGTRWERWELDPVESRVLRTRVPTVDRGFAAVVEASVLASRLDVPGYDETVLRDRLAYCAAVVERAGGPQDRAALDRVGTHVGVDLEAVRATDG